MKSLTLFRHAKSERDSTTGKDCDRQLSERGERDASRMGEEIRSWGPDYDLILSSPAVRAAQTAELAGLAPRFDERIYNAPAEQLVDIVQRTEAGVDRLLMVGHNPGMEQLASRLTGEIIEMPTGSLIQIDLAIDHWRDAGEAKGSVARFLRPKKLD